MYFRMWLSKNIIRISIILFISSYVLKFNKVTAESNVRVAMETVVTVAQMATTRLVEIVTSVRSAARRVQTTVVVKRVS